MLSTEGLRQWKDITPSLTNFSVQNCVEVYGRRSRRVLRYTLRVPISDVDSIDFWNKPSCRARLAAPRTNKIIDIQLLLLLPRESRAVCRCQISFLSARGRAAWHGASAHNNNTPLYTIFFILYYFSSNTSATRRVILRAKTEYNKLPYIRSYINERARNRLKAQHRDGGCAPRGVHSAVTVRFKLRLWDRAYSEGSRGGCSSSGDVSARATTTAGMANKPAAAAAAAPYYTPVALRIPSLHRGQIDLARAPCKFLFIKMPVRARASARQYSLFQLKCESFEIEESHSPKWILE
ncbi:unnamed protein product [Trichogramma brassicae]|uniref:Uncharacterized protein n=1 Tax=Trichogramma brassicae TaxID=86971 RepID=A0A6H5I2U1_9HYME|nr:unnamed protein product [Trichogramma brassicae]